MSKNILLACSNYYPHSFGGTEVYVESCAKFLTDQGNTVYIITASPAEYFTIENTIYDDEKLSVCKYYYNDVMVFGLHYKKPISTDFIYSKYDIKSASSWGNFLKQQPELCALTKLHIHSFTATIGLNLFKAVIKHNNGIKVISSYHTPISCPKNTLMRGRTLSECKITPNIKDCTNCIIQTQDKIPNIMAKAVQILHLKNCALPAIFRQSHLVNLELNAFNQLKEITQEWWCYSEGIKNILIKNKVNKEQIKFARHGIAELFFNQNIKKRADKAIYLYSGRLAKIKGVVTLLKAWLTLADSATKELWITASTNSIDDAEINKLVKKIQSRNDVKFIGSKDQQELSKIYKKAHFIIIPSECFEIGPLVFHEALANDCNIIASDIGGARELAKHYHLEHNLFEPRNTHSLQKKIDESRFIKLPKISPLKSNQHFQILTK